MIYEQVDRQSVTRGSDDATRGTEVTQEAEVQLMWVTGSQAKDGRRVMQQQESLVAASPAAPSAGHVIVPTDGKHEARTVRRSSTATQMTMSSDNNWTLRFQGAEARVYFGSFGGKAAVKKERFEKKYRHPLLDEQLRKQRTRHEVKAMTRIRDRSPRLSGLMPAILFSDSHTIIMEEVLDSKPCVEVIQAEITSDGDTNWIFEGIGSLVAEIHGMGIVHGDLTTSNLLIRGQDIIPIDFGLSSSSASAEDRAVDLYVLERALLSSHVTADKFQILMQSYEKSLRESGMKEKDVDSVMKKLDEVRMRGRKRCMAG